MIGYLQNMIISIFNVKVIKLCITKLSHILWSILVSIIKSTTYRISCKHHAEKDAKTTFLQWDISQSCKK